jgi:hypothetical protein
MISHSRRAVIIQCDYDNCVVVDPAIPPVSGCSREQSVAHIGKAGDVGEGALEAEARVRHRAIAARSPTLTLPRSQGG